MRLRVPLAAPAVVPFNQTTKLALCPASSVAGIDMLDSVNSLFEKLACEIVTIALPVFVTVAFCETLPPIVTLPKLKLDGLIENEAAGGGVPPPFPLGVFAVTTPEHPLIIPRAATATSSANACHTRAPVCAPTFTHFARFDTWNRCAIGLDLPRRSREEA
jgi:hypothetical protein